MLRGTAGPRRGGRPRTDEERRIRHKRIYGQRIKGELGEYKWWLRGHPGFTNVGSGAWKDWFKRRPKVGR